ncbi:hypothetical protein SUREIYA_00290 [Serratia phage vB_SmaM-Sureiya]|nr:hypothetical protein SUREIYA_00290 [Serratia phage vB_SmaM-Sureiya]
MKNTPIGRWNVILDGKLIKVVDRQTGGELNIHTTHHDDPGENDLNPTIEIINELSEQLAEQRLILQLIGKENNIYVTGTNMVLDGSLSLHRVDLANPHLTDVELRIVDTREAKQVRMNKTTMYEFTSPKLEGELHISHCHYTGVAKPRVTSSRTEFYLNECRNGDMW